MGKARHGKRHTPQPWTRSPISGCCHRTVLPSMDETDVKEFVLVIGDSHLRSFVDGYVAMPTDKFTFGFMCTPGASANGLRKEICHAGELPHDPEVVCLLAPGNNLVSSPTIDMASKDFGSLLKAALYRWPKLFVLEFPIRFPDQHDGDIPLDYQVHLQQEYHRVAARMGVRYLSTTGHFPTWNRLLWCHDGVHLSDDHGMPILADLIWQASYNVLHVPINPVRHRVRPAPPRHRHTATHNETPPPPQPTCPAPPQLPATPPCWKHRHGRRRCVPTSKAEQKYMDILQDGANRRIVAVKSVAVIYSPSSYRVPVPPQPASEPKPQRQRHRWRRTNSSSGTPN